MKHLEVKLAQAERAKDLAQIEGHLPILLDTCDVIQLSTDFRFF